MRRRRPARQRSALGWGLAFFALGQLALILTMEYWRPELADPEYGIKLACLRARLAERPDCRPLIVVLGSSRVSMGLRPEHLVVNRSPARRTPLVFNFGICQSGLTTQLLCLRRLLADGVRPDVVAIEFYAPLLAKDDAIVDRFDIRRLRWDDERLYRRYVSRPEVLRRRWWRGELVPIFYHRALLWNVWMPELLDKDQRLDSQWRGLQPEGWVAIPWFSQRQPAVDKEVAENHRCVLERFQVCAVANRALRELLALCRDRQITVGCLLLPESSAFRGAYTAAMETGLVSFKQQVERNFNVPVIDARAWMSDEHMVDGVHLTHAGALAFTRLFEKRVLPHLLEAWSERFCSSLVGCRWANAFSVRKKGDGNFEDLQPGRLPEAK
ncbi:MAG: hypothetical protein E6K70_06080 [Planctomycetota bacterium]|nr:MAG: hypothetical protein E6K70_06080 [Planctomycetota bacterium]